MEFGPHSSFVPQSPLSYSTSYVPYTSPTPLDNEKNQKRQENVGTCYNNNALIDETHNQQTQQHIENQKDQEKGHQKTLLSNPLKNWSLRKNNNKSILKNVSDDRGESQERKHLKYSSNQNLTTTSHSEKKTLTHHQPIQRKETLKTVAFGLTTNLDETVLGKEVKTSSTYRDNNRTKTIIFSHEAQSLHKLILEQKQQIDELTNTVDDLRNEQDKQRIGAREQIDIISALATRLYELEKQKNNINEATSSNIGNLITLKSSEKREKSATKSANKTSKIDKTSSDELLKEEKQNKEISVINRRNDFIQRLEHEMDRNPLFEQRLHSMLRVWSEDSDVSPLLNKNNNKNIHVEDETSCIPSMVMRVTTQRQEIFYSSPGRGNNIRRYPRVIDEERNGERGQRRNYQKERDDNRDNNHNNTRPKIKVVELSDDEKENNEHDETSEHYYREDHQTLNTNLRHVQRSDQIGTDEDAEFFQQHRSNYDEEDYNNEDDNDDDDEFFGGGEGGNRGSRDNHHNHDHRRGRTQDRHHQNSYHGENNNINQPPPPNRYPFNNQRRKREATSAIRNRYRQK